ncbi:hypothetical protein AC578_8497 [Pseudocercospora eumusae]|uniref:Apc15p protein-domain-containing protein n=1 Tax=Pseudocercospora eumusae TaxID=321146 RepID=A0A139HVY6_9PEZI|nr:hypothetical protein AC578_8497 [Pseudocercospora eumusae]
MLALPLIPPQDDQSSFLRTTYRPRADSPPPNNAQNQQQSHRERQRRDEERKLHHARSPLALLCADETAIEQRKAAVRNFGAQWIRPPGVPKTLQAMREEELERQEQAEIERQERGLLDMQAQQQLAEAQRQAAETADAQDAGEGDEEHDLDADIPDADAEGDQTTAETTFNEDSMMGGSQIQFPEDNDPDVDEELEVAELTGAARDEEDLGMGMGRDLDDSVPEAGSYQHTDTEQEDDSDSESELVSFVGRSAAQQASSLGDRSEMRPPSMAGLQNRMRAQVAAADGLPRSPGSINLSSPALDSSMATSSPVVQRSNAGGRGRGRRAR